MKYLSLAFLLGVVFAFGSVFAYVSPGKPTSYVNDYAGVLNVKTKADLEALLGNFRTSGKGEVSVVIVSTLGGDSIENYALELGREWGVGKKGKDNGALLLIAKEERELRIEVGYGLEGVLTDAKSSRIIRDVITPRFKEGNYDAGVMNGVREVLGVIDPTFSGGTQTVDYTSAPAVASNSTDITWVLPIIFFLFPMLIIWVSSVLARSKSWYAGGIIGGIIGIIIAGLIGLFYGGIISIVLFGGIGLVFDYFVSKGYLKSKDGGTRPPWWTGGGSSGGSSSSGGGFGGFGGGSFGGGGASGKW